MTDMTATLDADRLRVLRDEYGDYDENARLGAVYGTATIGEFVLAINTALAALDAETPATPADVGEEPVGYLFRLRYGPNTWSQQDMFSDVLPEDRDDVKDVRPLYSATALERVVRDRDDARAWSKRHHADLVSAEANLAEARKLVERFSNGGVDVSGTAIIVGYPEAKTLWTDARRFLEETK